MDTWCLPRQLYQETCFHLSIRTLQNGSWGQTPVPQTQTFLVQISDCNPRLALIGSALSLGLGVYFIPLMQVASWPLCFKKIKKNKNKIWLHYPASNLIISFVNKKEKKLGTITVLLCTDFSWASVHLHNKLHVSQATSPKVQNNEVNWKTYLE
jgi:hypothetical protein